MNGKEVTAADNQRCFNLLFSKLNEVK